MFPKPIILALTATVLLLPQTVAADTCERETIDNAVLDLRGCSFEDTPAISLQGDIEFYWQHFYSPRQFKKKKFKKQIKAKRDYIKFPASWADESAVRNNPAKPSHGWATFRFFVRTDKLTEPLSIWLGAVGTAYRLFLNGREISTAGIAGNGIDEHKADLFRPLLTLPVNKTKHEIIVHISNYDVLRGGFWDQSYIGKFKAVNSKRNTGLLADLLVFGSMCVGTVYFFVIFLVWRREKALLYFSALCGLMGLRALLTGNRIIYDFFPNNFEFLFRIEYITFYLAPPVFVYFVRHMLAGSTNRWVNRFFAAAGILFSASVLILPVIEYTQHLHYYQMITVAAVLYIIGALSFALYKRRYSALVFLSGFLLISFAVYNDLMYVNTGSAPMGFQFGTLAIVMFLVPLAILLGIRLTSTAKENHVLNKQITEQNKAFLKFVPLEFLNILEKKDIKNLGLGDKVKRDATILFADIRRYTSLTEDLDSEEVLDFLNSYLSKVVPIIMENGGVIDKYIGDNIMAFFFENSSAAIDTAIAMQTAIREYNEGREKAGYERIQVGIALHYGEICAGTIGHKERMNATAVSDAVNLASRIEGLCSVYRAQILVSGEMFTATDDPTMYRYRIIDRVQVRNREEPVVVYEILNGQSNSAIERYNQTVGSFERAMFAFLTEDYARALPLFQDCWAKNPTDHVAARYVGRCNRLLAKV